MGEVRARSRANRPRPCPQAGDAAHRQSPADAQSRHSVAQARSRRTRAGAQPKWPRSKVATSAARSAIGSTGWDVPGRATNAISVSGSIPARGMHRRPAGRAAWTICPRSPPATPHAQSGAVQHRDAVNIWICSAVFETWSSPRSTSVTPSRYRRSRWAACRATNRPRGGPPDRTIAPARNAGVRARRPAIRSAMHGRA